MSQARWKRMWNPWEWIKLLYETVGYKHPIVSAILFALVFACCGLIIWWRVDMQYRKDHPVISTLHPQTYVKVFLGSFDKNQPIPVSNADIRIQNNGSEADHKVYIRLSVNRITKVTVDNPDRVTIIGGGQGLRLSPTADLEILIPELLAEEIRTVLVDVNQTTMREGWEVSVRSDRYPIARKAYWPLRKELENAEGIEIIRPEYTIGPEVVLPQE